MSKVLASDTICESKTWSYTIIKDFPYLFRVLFSVNFSYEFIFEEQDNDTSNLIYHLGCHGVRHACINMSLFNVVTTFFKINIDCIFHFPQSKIVLFGKLLDNPLRTHGVHL